MNFKAHRPAKALVISDLETPQLLGLLHISGLETPQLLGLLQPRNFHCDPVSHIQLSFFSIH
jgi:hypothetical protein